MNAKNMGFKKAFAMFLANKSGSICANSATSTVKSFALN